MEEENDLENQLLLLKKGSKIDFSGVFSGHNINGHSWFVENCKF